MPKASTGDRRIFTARAIRLILIAAVLLAVRPAIGDNSSSSAPRIDELSYWAQINRTNRQDLHQGLMLKPQYRGQYLAGRTYLEIRQQNYSSDRQDADERWVAAHQSAERSFHPEPNSLIAVAGYPIENFVGYRVGNARFFDRDGMCYKVFFDFNDPTRDLTPELYLQFTRALATAGFAGDSKIAMLPGFARLFYNDVIVHTGSPEQAKLAAKVGMEVFGSRVAHIARGVDVTQVVGGARDTKDWHEFLSQAKDLSSLSVRAKAYVSWTDN